MDIKLLHQIILHTLSVSSFLLNICFIIVILHRDCKLIGDYRYLLVSFAILDIITSVLSLVTCPIVIVSEYGILTVSMNLLDLPGYVENLGTQLFSITFYAPFLLLTFNFIYRYRALVRPASNGSISRKMFASAFFIFIAYACLASVPSNLASMERDKNRRFFLNASPFTESYLSRDDSKPMTLPYFHDPLKGEHFDETTLNVLIASSIIVSIPLVANAILMIQILRQTTSSNVLVLSISYTISLIRIEERACDLKRVRPCLFSRTINRRLRVLQFQLNRALILQFVIPSLFYTLPFIVVLGMPFTGIDIGYSVNFIILAPTLYTVIDPIMIVLTVSRFRDVITGFYSRRDRRAKKNERNEMERSRAYQDIIRKRQISTVI